MNERAISVLFEPFRGPGPPEIGASKWQVENILSFLMAMLYGFYGPLAMWTVIERYHGPAIVSGAAHEFIGR